MSSSCLNHLRMSNGDCGPTSSSRENLVPCDHFVFERSVFESTATEDFGMICDQAWRKSTAMSLHMLGMLIGSFFFGYLGDHYGRKSSLIISNSLLALCGSGATLLSAGDSNYIFFAISRFFVGLGQGGCIVAGFTLVMEIVGKKWRVFVAIFTGVPFALGGLVMGVAAWAGMRSWRPLLLAFSLPNVLAVILALFIPESPRWLLVEGKMPQLRKDVKRLCRWNGTRYPTELLDNDHIVVKGATEESEHTSESFLDMFRPRAMLFRTLVVFYNWLVCTLSYYGLTMSALTLSSDFFLSYILVILVEVPSYFVCYHALDWMGRKTLLVVAQCMAGSLCISASLVQHIPWLQIGLSIFGKLCATISFAMVFLITAELYPTDIRSTATGSSSMCARIGGILAPQVVSLASIWTPLPLFVMGGSALIAGMLAIPIIPETKGKPLPETIEEALSIGRIQVDKDVITLSNQTRGTKL